MKTPEEIMPPGYIFFAGNADAFRLSPHKLDAQSRGLKAENSPPPPMGCSDSK
jgi:hypothetical protein